MDNPQDTNITPEMQVAFEAIASGQHSNFALFSCFLDGKPTAAIVAINEGIGGGVAVTPLFIAVTSDIGPRLTDHDGVAPHRAPVGELEPDWDMLFGLLGNDTNN